MTTVDKSMRTLRSPSPFILFPRAVWGEEGKRVRHPQRFVTLRVLIVTALVVIAALSARSSYGAAAARVAARPSAGCRTDAVERGRRLQRTIKINGVERLYILDVPDTIQSNVPAPLLFDFHGFGHSAAGVWQVSAFRTLAEREAFITVYPDGLPVQLPIHGQSYTRPGWEIFSREANRDVEFTTRLLDYLEQQYCIDRARVFATGFSNGAFFSQLLACTMADRIAAVAPVSGGLLSVECRPQRGVPVLIHHGRQDDLIDVQQGRQARDRWAQINGCSDSAQQQACQRYSGCRNGATVEYCEDDFAHTWPPQATTRIWEFFRRHPMPM